MSVRKNLFVVLVAVSTFSMLAESSQAFFGLFHGGSCGSWGGGWGGRGGGGSRGGWGGCGSSGGSWGGSYGGSYGGYGSNGSSGSYGGVYSSGYFDGGYMGGYAQRGGVVYDRVVRTQPNPVPSIVQSNVPTRLTLHVPAAAKVTLAGVTTQQTGEVRQYTTSKLPSGQVWDGYNVVVTLDRDGQTLREERTIQLTGGQTQELSISFDSQQLAQR